MRLVVWNCCNGLGQNDQIEQFKSLGADVAILPELKQHNIDALAPDDAVWVTNNHSNPSPKGLGVLAFNGAVLRPLDRDEDMEIYIPIEFESGDVRGTLLAVWNFYHASKQGRFRGIKGDRCLEYEAIRHYENLMTGSFIIAGDFNFGPTFSGTAFAKMCEMLGDRGVASLYHKHFGIDETASGHPTFKGTLGHLHHLDHVFGSKLIQDKLTGFEVMPFEDVIRSDHAPLSAELRNQQPLTSASQTPSE